LENISDSETMINGNLMKECVELSNMDVFSISGRSFRFEYEQPKRKVNIIISCINFKM
jgi:hypothetical protein